MATIDEAVRFFNEFAKAERAALLALWTNHDDQATDKAIDALNLGFFTGDLQGEVDGPPERDAEYFKNKREQPDANKERSLFKVARYEGGKGGDVFRAYMSSTWKESDTYFTSLYAAERKGELRIVAQYNRCTECNGTGKVGKKKCPECGGSGWNWRGGEKIGDLGKPKEVRKLAEPADEQDRLDYEAG